MKVGRKTSENRLYAERMGVPYRTVMRHGGAHHLMQLSEQVQRMLLGISECINQRDVKGA